MYLWRSSISSLRATANTFQRDTHNTIANDWNKAMSSFCVSVEWVFDNIINYFKFLDSKKKLKIQLSAVGKMYIICALLHNSRCCFYGSTTQTFFDIEAPEIRDYFL